MWGGLGAQRAQKPTRLVFCVCNDRVLQNCAPMLVDLLFSSGLPKTQKKHTKNNKNTNCTKKHPPRVSHERGFRVLKCIRVGFWARWAPRPPTHGPKTPPNHDLLLICVPSGLICRRFLVHIFKKTRNVTAHWCAIGNAFFQQNMGTLEMKQTSGLARGRHSWHGGGVAEGIWILISR